MKAKKVLSFLTGLTMVFTLLLAAPAAQNERSLNSYVTAEAKASDFTSDQAVAWANNCAATKWNVDVDGNGHWCVDLILAYYSYLGVSRAPGNATDYQTNQLPSGWTRVKSSPKPGDIIVWAGNSKMSPTYTTVSAGHIGIVVAVSGNNLTTVETNSDGKTTYAKKRSRDASYAACFIRPNFSNNPTHKGCVNAKLEPFYFKNKATNTYMKASEAKNAGKMSLAAKKQNDSFIFSINGSKADGYYLESNLNKKFVVNPYSDTPSNGTAINMYKKNTDGTQLWEFDKCNGGFIIHMRYDPNLCLGADGSSIKLQNRTESDKQIWILEYKEEPSPDSISISTPATYDTYPVGAALDTTGLAITLHNSDGSTKEITSGFTASADLSAEGSATVTVTYEGKTVTYGVEVINYFEGQGTEASPYLINSEWDLKQLSDIMNTLSVCPAYKNAYYQQTADIDLVGELFTPIGICRSDDKVDGRLSFNGVYDGNKHSIANLYVDWSDNYSGLFGRTQANSVIKDLSVYGDVTGGGACTGGIVGEVGYGGKIINCSFNGSVYGTALVGGITSSLQGGGTVQGCYVNAGVQTEDSGETAWVGGIVGRPHVGNSKSSVDAVISDCYFTGYISGAVSGGIIGKTVIETTKSNTVKCSNNYFSDNLGVNASGDGSVNESGGRQLSDEMMKNANELLGLPFVKNFNDGFNDGYPVFEWQEPIPEPPYAYMLGDVSGDGNIDIEDAVLVIGYVNGQTVLTDEELLRADTDLNNDIDIEDAVAIISHVNGINALF